MNAAQDLSLPEEQNTKVRYFPWAMVLIAAIAIATQVLKVRFFLLHQAEGLEPLQLLAEFGGVSGNFLGGAGWIRSVSSIFVHNEVGMLFLNIIYILTFGTMLERRIGSFAALAIFFLGGILGSIFSVLFSYPMIIHYGAENAAWAMTVSVLIAFPPKIEFKNRHLNNAFNFPMLVLFLPMVDLKYRPDFYFAGFLAGSLVGLGAGLAIRFKWIEFAQHSKASAYAAYCIVAVCFAAYAIYIFSAQKLYGILW